MMLQIRQALTLLLVIGWLSATATAQKSPIRVGVIGLDTSHSTAFTQILNDSTAGPDVAGFQVVAAYPHGSADIESSVSRIPRYTEEMQEMGVEIVTSISELLDQVDVVLLETNDGRLHLEQALEVIGRGKPLFIDKPVAASLVDVLRIYRAAGEASVPVFSSSSLRYAAAAQEVRAGKHGAVRGADTFSPATLEPTHPDLYWYGIHGIEMLYTVMGPGCRTVTRFHSDSTDVVVGDWGEGRIGTFRGLRAGRRDYGGTAFTDDAIVSLGNYEGYRGLLVEIASFFRSGTAPVEAEETIEIYAFMEAAEESKRQGGAPVSIESVLARARREAGIP